jgi:hypothetical protein
MATKEGSVPQILKRPGPSADNTGEDNATNQEGDAAWSPSEDAVIFALRDSEET